MLVRAVVCFCCEQSVADLIKFFGREVPLEQEKILVNFRHLPPPSKLLSRVQLKALDNFDKAPVLPVNRRCGKGPNPPGDLILAGRAWRRRESESNQAATVTVVEDAGNAAERGLN